MNAALRKFTSALRATGVPRSSPDWFDLVDYAGTNGLAGLLLAAPLASQAPEWARSMLQASAQQVGERNLQMMEELSRVAGAMADARIPLMPLKGAALLLTAYPREPLRPMSDLDLLVHPEHASRAVELLCALGYRQGAGLLRENFFPRWYYEIEMLLPGRRTVRIDLHAHPWRPLPLARIVRHEDFWEGSLENHAGGVSVRLPAPETLFVHLAAHAAFHDCSRFIWLYDLRRVANHYGRAMDWALVVDRARRWRLSLAVKTAVAAAERELGPFVPEEATAALRSNSPGWRERLMLWHAPRDAASPLLHVACNTIGLGGIRPRLEYLQAILSPNNRHLGEIYPFRHLGWPVCAHLFRIARNLGRLVCLAMAPFRRMFRHAGVHA